MELAIVTPVLTRTARGHARWEPDADFAEVVRIARAADALGFHHLTCSEHVGIPVDVAAVRGGTYWDPLAVFGYLAAVTERIRFATFVVVLGYHHPLELVKQYGTLDRVCGGRLILGVGVGSLEQEFDLLGAPFEGRGERGDDSIRAMHASFGLPEPEYHGSHYDYSGFIIDPVSIQAPVPIWIGGRTRRSLRRAVELAEGWAPFGLTLDEMKVMLDGARETEAWAARTEPLEIALQPNALDPMGDPDGTRAVLAEMEAMGATVAETRVRSTSVEEYLDQIAALRELVTS